MALARRSSASDQLPALRTRILNPSTAATARWRVASSHTASSRTRRANFSNAAAAAAIVD